MAVLALSNVWFEKWLQIWSERIQHAITGRGNNEEDPIIIWWGVITLLFQEKAGETPEKEQIELTEAEEKGDQGKEDKKKKKEKKKKEPKEKKPKGPNCIDTLSAGLNLEARDGKAINTEIDVSFLVAFNQAINQKSAVFECK